MLGSLRARQKPAMRQVAGQISRPRGQDAFRHRRWMANLRTWSVGW